MAVRYLFGYQMEGTKVEKFYCCIDFNSIVSISTNVGRTQSFGPGGQKRKFEQHKCSCEGQCAHGGVCIFSSVGTGTFSPQLQMLSSEVEARLREL